MTEARRFYAESEDYLAHLSAKPDAYFLGYVEDLCRWLPRGARLLELGCGSGQSTKLLAERGIDVLGTDLSPRFVARCAAAYPNLAFEVVDITRRTPLPGSSFDAITSFAVLEHVTDVEAALDECDRLLRPGGLLFIYGPNLLSPFSALRSVASALRRREPVESPVFSGVLGALGFVARSVLRIEAKKRGRVEFLRRTPDFARGRHGGDWDASYLQTQADYAHWLRARGYEVLRVARSFGGPVARAVSRLFPYYAGGCGIVARRPGRG
jgi:SAM-dependent methyltransferase